MNEFYLPNICYNNRRDTQKLCLAYIKDTIKYMIYIYIYIYRYDGKHICLLYLYI